MVKPAVTSARGGDTDNGVRACDVPLRRRGIKSPRTTSVSVFFVAAEMIFHVSSGVPPRRRPPLHRQPPRAHVAATAAAALSRR